jgi:hypothetical protein
MPKHIPVILLSACFLLAGSEAYPDARSDQTLRVAETPDTLEISVPVSRIKLLVPRGAFKVQLAPPTGSGSRHFNLGNEKGVVVSGWFEPSQAYKGIQGLWASETSAWKKNKLPKAKNPTFSTVDSWEVILYENVLGKLRNTHMRAELTKDGTWIDLHISITGAASESAARAQAIELLKALKIASNEQPVA